MDRCLMDWGNLLKTLVHAAAGFGIAYGGAYAQLPGTDPLIAAALGSAITSAVSALSKSTKPRSKKSAVR